MISTSQREHLTYTLIGQTVTFLAVGIVIWQYIIPGFAEIDNNLTAANSKVNGYLEARDKGYSYAQVSAILTELGNKEELLKIIQATRDETIRALQKQGNSDYLTWIKNAINASDEDKKKLIQSKKKINSILPTMSPISANIDEENITLKQYIKFIEGRILMKYNLDSNIALGIQSLNYGNPGNKIPSSIGMFDFRLDFKASNENIKGFIDFVNESGNTDILTDSGLLSEDQIPEIMSNPLITMESLSIQDTLDMSNPKKINNGRTTIRFYIRGSSKEDVTYLRENLKTRKEELGKRVEVAVSDCRKNEVLCSQLSKLTEFQTKYTEFIRGVGGEGSAAGVSINDIYSLSQQVSSLRALEAEFNSFNAKISQ